MRFALYLKGPLKFEQINNKVSVWSLSLLYRTQKQKQTKYIFLISVRKKKKT